MVFFDPSSGLWSLAARPATPPLAGEPPALRRPPASAQWPTPRPAPVAHRPLHSHRLNVPSRLEWGAGVLASALPSLAGALLLAAWPVPSPPPLPARTPALRPSPAEPVKRRRWPAWRRAPSPQEQARQREREQRLATAAQSLSRALNDAWQALQLPLPYPHYGLALVRQGACLRRTLEQIARQVGWPATLVAFERVLREGV